MRAVLAASKELSEMNVSVVGMLLLAAAAVRLVARQRAAADAGRSSRARPAGSAGRPEARAARRGQGGAAPGARRLDAEAVRLLRSRRARWRTDAARADPQEPTSRSRPHRNAAPAAPAPRSGGLSFANSDLAFQGEHLFIGNFNGFNTYDIEDPEESAPDRVGGLPGRAGRRLGSWQPAGHVGRADAGADGLRHAGASTPVSAERFRGVRIFDISDVRKPRQVAAVQTCRGSHTHTLVTDPNDKENLYVYGSGTSAVRSAEELAGCSNKDPKDDPNTALFSIDVIQVPLAAPEKAADRQPPAHLRRPGDRQHRGPVAGRHAGPGHAEGARRPTSATTSRCFPKLGLAAGACSGNGILLDISDPVHPVRLDAVADKNFAYWHSATFNNDGTKVIFTDEWGGGTRPRCRPTDPPTWGADAIFDVVDGKLRFGGYYKLPAPQTEQENCVAHNGSLSRCPGATSWCRPGIREVVRCSTSPIRPSRSRLPTSIAGRSTPGTLITGGYWSTYWYNGHIYGSEIARGLDVFKLTAE